MKSLWISLLLLVSLQAQDNLAQYDISMKMLGEIGTSKLSMHATQDTYEIKMHIQMDESLSDVEHRYESYGSIEGNVYKPTRFVKYIREGADEEVIYYIFDYDKREIQKYTTTTKTSSALASLFGSEDKVVTKSYAVLTDFRPNDTLTTFLNAEQLLAGRDTMAIESVGFRKSERNITLYKKDGAYRVSIVDKEASDDYSIVVSIAPDGLISEIAIKEYTILGTISVARSE